MGQKVNPNILRLGILHSWDSRWFAEKKRYPNLLLEDIRLRNMLMERLKTAAISRVLIERSIKKIDITLYVARPGVAIGRGGEELNKIKRKVEDFFKGKKPKMKIEIKIEPIKEPNLDPYLVAQSIAEQLVKRIPHKRVVKKVMDKVIGSGAKGIKIVLSGRIRGAEIARREKYSSGTVPLSTIREDVVFAKYPALTKSGYIGVKVWICK